MAGRGPTPKDQKLSRPRPGDGVEVLSSDPVTPAVMLAESYRVEELLVEFLPETREWFDAWCSSPMASKFAVTDWHRLARVIAPIYDAYVRGPSTKLAAELRLQETLLGATAQDRQRLRWALPAPEEAPERAVRASKASADRRGRLSVVA